MIIRETFERQKLYEFARKLLKANKAKSILDMACGDGEGADILAKEQGFTVLGMDINQKLIARAKEVYSTWNLQFAVDDARHTVLKDSSFDAVVSSHTLEHFNETDQKNFLAEVRRILRPHGWFVVATPDREVWKIQGIAGRQEDHVRELGQIEARNLLLASGFAVKEVYGQELLKKGNFILRKMLNFLKRVDVLKLRHLLVKDSLLGNIDERTQPVTLTGEVLPLGDNTKASINVFICEKS